MQQSLSNKLSSAIEMGFIPIQVPQYIADSINPAFLIRPYQQEAFSRFIYYTDQYPQRTRPSQVLYHMATGSGKTLIMAGCILHLYTLGYRNFIFFVNSSTIIEKTKDNFLNKASSKYLFSDSITIGDQRVEVQAVDNFEAVSGQDINIVFTTIQGLHTRLNTPRENSLTYEDFLDQKVVLLSDEAHHINAETKKGKLNKSEVEAITSWEQTVTKIFNANADNYLLEFTATADLANTAIAEKYQDKLIFDYPLKAFRKDLYSKEVKLLQTESVPFERALQAVIVSQYRKKVFQHHQLNIKPVILFKSKTIADSQAFLQEFVDRIAALQVSDLDRLISQESDTVVQEAFTYFAEQNITLANLMIELKDDFSEAKCIAVDSKNDSEEKQLIINSLEDESNEYRAVFAVDKLNEGWDVLNLFDIVRMYNSRDADHKTGKVGKTTMSEAQLIGRGARYCPFQIDDEQPLYQRKYDDDVDNQLRICEELYYHATYNPKYISELNKALEQIGLKSSSSVELDLFVKPEFKDTDFYKKGIIYVNKRSVYDRKDVEGIDPSIINHRETHKILTGQSRESTAFKDDLAMLSAKASEPHRLQSFGPTIIRKAMARLPFYKFDVLQYYLPNLESVSQFIEDDRYLGKVSVEVSGTIQRVNNLSPEDKLEASITALDYIAQAIPGVTVDYTGTKAFSPVAISKTFTDKTLSVTVDGEYGIPQTKTTNTDLFLDLSNEDWYAFNDNYGTSEEKYLVRYIKNVYEKFKDQYDSIYLLRNEKHFKLYSFDDGRAIEPDFVFFLSKKKDKKTAIYQIFIEPKGQHLMEKDKWKEDFLQQIAETHQLETVWENKDVKLIGMQFYNETLRKTYFEEDMLKIVQQ